MQHRLPTLFTRRRRLLFCSPGVHSTESGGVHGGLYFFDHDNTLLALHHVRCSFQVRAKQQHLPAALILCAQQNDCSRYSVDLQKAIRRRQCKPSRGCALPTLHGGSTAEGRCIMFQSSHSYNSFGNANPPGLKTRTRRHGDVWAFASPKKKQSNAHLPTNATSHFSLPPS